METSHEKPRGSFVREATLFLVHTLAAALFLAIAVGVMSLNNPDPDAWQPKLIATISVFFVPLIASFLLARIHRNEIASHVWVAGLIVFSFACVLILNLPTGSGLCETCGTTEKLWRTFFSFRDGSGLLGGDGLLIGTWTPLAMIGYSIGAKLAL